jgi:hypothetical protein
MGLKRLACVVSGWHFPLHFYEAIAKQQIPKGWKVDLFCVSHRDPKHAKVPKFDTTTRRGRLDSVLYSSLAKVKDLEALGWNYKEYPNTIGDWGNSNQWLEENNYKDYDLFLFSHDDNLILNNDLFNQVCGMYDQDWLILTNTVGVPAGSIRGSFEFFKKKMLDKMGGKFDLSQTTLDRTGSKDNPSKWAELYDWNTTVYPLTNLLTQKKLWNKIIVLSPFYRVSAYCIEGERGTISSTQAFNEEYEEAGLNQLEQYGLI